MGAMEEEEARLLGLQAALENSSRSSDPLVVEVIRRLIERRASDSPSVDRLFSVRPDLYEDIARGEGAMSILAIDTLPPSLVDVAPTSSASTSSASTSSASTSSASTSSASTSSASTSPTSSFAPTAPTASTVASPVSAFVDAMSVHLDGALMRTMFALYHHRHRETRGSSLWKEVYGVLSEWDDAALRYLCHMAPGVAPALRTCSTAHDIWVVLGSCWHHHQQPMVDWLADGRPMSADRLGTEGSLGQLSCTSSPTVKQTVAPLVKSISEDGEINDKHDGLSSSRLTIWTARPQQQLLRPRLEEEVRRDPFLAHVAPVNVRPRQAQAQTQAQKTTQNDPFCPELLESVRRRHRISDADDALFAAALQAVRRALAGEPHHIPPAVCPSSASPTSWSAHQYRRRNAIWCLFVDLLTAHMQMMGS